MAKKRCWIKRDVEYIKLNQGSLNSSELASLCCLGNATSVPLYLNPIFNNASPPGSMLFNRYIDRLFPSASARIWDLLLLEQVLPDADSWFN